MVQVTCYQFLMFHCNKQTGIPLCVCVSVLNSITVPAGITTSLMWSRQIKGKINFQCIYVLCSPLANIMKKECNSVKPNSIQLICTHGNKLTDTCSTQMLANIQMHQH